MGLAICWRLGVDLGASGVLAGGDWFIMKAYLIGEVTYVSIFEYSMLIFASITAWVLFGDKVQLLEFLGIGLIIITGIVISLRSKADE